MHPSLQMVLEGRIGEVARVATAFAGFAAAHNVPDDVRRSLHVVLDDLLANVLLHGLAGRANGEATLDVTRTADAVIVRISDNGPPFDPLAHAAPDTALSIEDRQIGGLGLHLVRRIMDEVHYERRGDRNVTVLTKRLLDGTAARANGAT